jgi:hypothetical protein
MCLISQKFSGFSTATRKLSTAPSPLGAAAGFVKPTRRYPSVIYPTL